MLTCNKFAEKAALFHPINHYPIRLFLLARFRATLWRQKRTNSPVRESTGGCKTQRERALRRTEQKCAFATDAG